MQLKQLYYAPKFIGSNLDYDVFMNEPINELQIVNKITTQREAIAAVKNKLYLVGSVSDIGNVSFSNTPAIHGYINDARTEARRLASVTPGKAYVIVQLVGAELVPNSHISI